MKILITGGTGFLGTAVSERFLRAGHELVVLTRKVPSKKERGIEFIQYDYSHDELLEEVFRGIDGVIHLAGEDLSSSRWSKSKKEAIRSSRVDYTKKIVSFINQNIKLKFFLSASAVGFYPQTKDDQSFDEYSSSGNDFLSQICRAWEAEVLKLKNAERILITRFGVVLGKNGGALKKALPVFQAGTGGRIGDGRQWMSWIHIDDLVEALLTLISSETQGVFNMTSPYPVRNVEFTETLANVLHRPAFMPVPETVLKLMVGEMATLLLSSQRVLPKRLEALGFSFKYPELSKALEHLLKH